ncbi:MAG: hypothetical protein AAF067_13045, partial [Pseudomonadota bacterium]
AQLESASSDRDTKYGGALNWQKFSWQYRDSVVSIRGQSNLQLICELIDSLSEYSSLALKEELTDQEQVELKNLGIRIYLSPVFKSQDDQSTLEFLLNIYEKFDFDERKRRITKLILRYNSYISDSYAKILTAR